MVRISKKLLVLLFIFIFVSNLSVLGRMYEKDYVNEYCSGKVEYILPDKTRVDCLTEEYAIEFDYAKKWAESIGQALYYSKMTNKKPAVAIIIKKPSDEKYVRRIHKAAPDITVFVIPSECNNK